jgi:hypothetical protein
MGIRRAGVESILRIAFRIDVWDAAGDNMVEHLAGLDDQATQFRSCWGAL